MKIKYGKGSSDKSRIAVRGILINDNLLGIIKVDKYDCFIFPGGEVNGDEDLEGALRREILEETGYIVEVKKHILTTETFEYDMMHINHYYECNIISKSATNLTEEEIGLGIHFEFIDMIEAYRYYMNYHDDLRFGEQNKIVQRSIRSRGYILMQVLLKTEPNYSTYLREWIGKEVEVEIDRPKGTIHKGIEYKLDYGYVSGIYSIDGEELDAYCLDGTRGKVIAVINRFDDEDKLIVADRDYTKEEIVKLTEFVEKYYESEVIM